MPICRMCHIRFPTRKIINGKVRNLQNRKYCLECSPFGSGNTRKLEIPRKGKRKRCKKSFYSKEKCREYQQRMRRERKRKLVEFLGGQCRICGYNKCLSALEFHHLKEEEKDFKSFAVAANGLRAGWKILVREIKKCILLCANCHREIHENMHDYLKLDVICDEEKLNQWILSKKPKPAKPKIYFCQICGKKISGFGKTGKCLECCSKARRKVMNRPSVEILQQEVNVIGYAGTGRKYGVSCHTVRQWLGKKKWSSNFNPNL